jgi:hypothetical protein
MASHGHDADRLEAAERAAAPHVAKLGRALRYVWDREWLFLLALTAFNVFLARRSFKDGIFADNDSVCHYAYARHLIEEFYPATGTFMGWTPKYDLGAPFLLYNTPPGLYVVTALVAKLTGLSPLAALKTVTVGAFLSVPLLGSRLAGTFEEDGAVGDLRKFAALTLSLFSSELFGLEFYFRNGMLNPALGVPLLITTLIFFRKAQRATGPGAIAWLVPAAGAFAATAFVHLLTTYMLGLALGCLACAEGWRRLGRSVLQVGTIAGLGGGLVAFWLLPSMHFAASQDAAFTWIRRWQDTVANYFNGSMLSSYPVGFYPQFVTFSAVGIVAILCGAFGVWRAFVERRPAVLACAGCALVSLLVTLGPRPSFGLWILPMYDRLLWYRFATLLELSTFLVAGWGAWRLWCLRGRFGRFVVLTLVGSALWAGLVMTQRAVRVETAQDYPGFTENVDRVSAWLHDHGKKGGRIYSEFLGQNVVDAVSVNYARHMIPILSGMPEAGGWIYENSEPAQEMMKRGLFWYDPFPIVSLAERYDVQYIVAGSPNLVRALTLDPRWRVTFATPHVTLFEAVGREPSLVGASGWDAQVVSEQYLRGGGYEYVLHVAPSPATAGEASRVLHVKTGWSPAWRAWSGGQELKVSPGPEALVDVDLGDSRAPRDIRLTWDIGAWRAQGNRVSLAALGVCLALLGLASRRAARLRDVVPERVLQVVGLAGAAVALVGLVVRAHPIDLSVVGFGVRDGLVIETDAHEVVVGAFDDDETYRPVRVLPGAWGDRMLVGATPARLLVHPELPAAVVTLSPVGRDTLTIVGHMDPRDGPADVGTVAVTLSEPGKIEPACRVEVPLGTAVVLPDACAAGAPGPGPGVTRTMQVTSPQPVVVASIAVQSGIEVVEAEQMRNVLDDGGYDAFMSYGPPKMYASHGVSMVAIAPLEMPIALDRWVSLPLPEYDVWLLTRTVSPRLHNGRAHFLVESDGREVADVDPRTRDAVPFWDDDPHPEWLPAGRMEGRGKHLVRVTFYKVKTAFNGLGDLDALAFVPATPR